MFVDRLIEQILEKKSPLCVGLDPRINRFPPYLQQMAESGHIKEAIVEFNKNVINNTKDLSAAVKLQIAFYELHGAEGISAFSESIEYAKENDLIVIADIKRSDIGDVAEMYAKRYLGELPIDAVTVNPYMGRDTVYPFLKYVDKNGKGIFVLMKTSNASSKDLQDVSVQGEPLYEKVGRIIEEMGKDYIGKYGFSSVGAVVGATFPEELKKIRSTFTTIFFLIPGFGAQGGSAKDAKYGFDKNGRGALVNSSRSIIYAFEQSNSNPWEAIRDAAVSARNTLREETLKYVTVD